MERLTSDNPWDNLSSALNLFYVKDGSAWVRDGGPAPEYKDISLDDYVRMISKEHDLDIAQSENDEDISCEMAELLFDGTDTVEGIIATLYCAGWAFAELRSRLSDYEDAIPLDRAQELAQAEKNGRLVVLPCKVGDFLYEVDIPEYGVITCKVSEIHTYFGPLGHAKGNPMVSTAAVSVEVIDGHGKGSGYTFETPEFGKYVFLTREEAEAALKNREADTCG